MLMSRWIRIQLPDPIRSCHGFVQPAGEFCLTAVHLCSVLEHRQAPHYPKPRVDGNSRLGRTRLPADQYHPVRPPDE